MDVALKLCMWWTSILHCFKEGKNFNDLWWPSPLRYGHKKICTIPVLCLTFEPQMKLIQPLVSGEFGNTHTDRQRTYGYYSIDYNPICARIYNQNYPLDVLFKCWFYLRIFASIMNNHNDWNWISNVYLESFIEFFTFFGKKKCCGQ